MRLSIFPSLLLLFIASGAAAGQVAKSPSGQQASKVLVLPTAVEAKEAIITLMGLTEMRNAMEVKLGTCIQAVEAKHPGQAACTVLVKIGSGSSETQADFYRAGKIWIAQPSVSQDKLPFPDPAF